MDHRAGQRRTSSAAIDRRGRAGQQAERWSVHAIPGPLNERSPVSDPNLYQPSNRLVMLEPLAFTVRPGP
ncbi:hypothetical protein [Halococcus sediminicola]|uniref:hypothetical protein n=1 Tax=Halococcus sediminicola TaxID=1264579 RepID=UPI000679BBF2|nr:hypothetical protein [Halococcus sediminicola]